jgi:hypothetical protein
MIGQYLPNKTKVRVEIFFNLNRGLVQGDWSNPERETTAEPNRTEGKDTWPGS